MQGENLKFKIVYLNNILNHTLLTQNYFNVHYFTAYYFSYIILNMQCEIPQLTTILSIEYIILLSK